MKVIVEQEVENCKECPFYEYGGTTWSEDFYICKKIEREVDGDGIDSRCPFIETTMERIQKTEPQKPRSH